MSSNTQGKIVVITGAGSGLGKAAAWLLSAEGARVACARCRNRVRRWVTSIAAAIAAPPVPIRPPARSSLERREIDEGNPVDIKGVLFGIATALPHM